MVESLTPNRKVVRLSRGPSEIVVGGVNTVLSSPSIPRRSALEQGTEVPTAPGRRSINGCPLLWVCVHGVCVHCCVCALGWVNAENEFRVWVAILGCMSRHWIILLNHTYSFLMFLLQSMHCTRLFLIDSFEHWKHSYVFIPADKYV